MQYAIPLDPGMVKLTSLATNHKNLIQTNDPVFKLEHNMIQRESNQLGE